jgi:hypothetical protein
MWLFFVWGLFYYANSLRETGWDEHGANGGGAAYSSSERRDFVF